MKRWISQYYRIIFASSLIEGLVFLALFLSGLARYLLPILFFGRGVLSAAREYSIVKKTNNILTDCWDVISMASIFAALLALVFDLNHGQWAPIFPELPVYVSVICMIAGYLLSMSLILYGRRIIEGMSGGEVFSVCPQCGHDNLDAVKTCSACGHKYGQPLSQDNNKAGFSPQQMSEIVRYRRYGLYRQPSRAVQAGVRLEEGEYILIAMRGPSLLHYVGLEKNGKAMPAGWFIITNVRLVCYHGRDGWHQIDSLPYSTISFAGVVKSRILARIREERVLEVRSGEDIYRFSFGPSRYRLLRRILFMDVSNEPIISNILDCMKRHGVAGVVAHL